MERADLDNCAEKCGPVQTEPDLNEDQKDALVRVLSNSFEMKGLSEISDFKHSICQMIQTFEA